MWKRGNFHKLITALLGSKIEHSFVLNTLLTKVSENKLLISKLYIIHLIIDLKVSWIKLERGFIQLTTSELFQISFGVPMRIQHAFRYSCILVIYVLAYTYKLIPTLLHIKSFSLYLVLHIVYNSKYIIFGFTQIFTTIRVNYKFRSSNNSNKYDWMI